MNFRSNTILVYLPKNQDDEVILNQALFFKQALGMRIFVLHILQIVPLLPQKLRIKWAQKIKKSGLIELTRIVKNTLLKEIPEDIFLRVKFGNVVQTLIKESRKGGYEFIIIDKSKGNLKWALKRSQVNKIINRSYCPVLVLNKEFPLITMNKIIIPFDISQPTRKRLLWATRLAKKFNAKIQIVSPSFDLAVVFLR